MEFLGDKHGLAQEALDLTSASNQQFLVFAQLINTQDGNDVLQILVGLENLLDFAGGTVMLFTDNIGGEGTAGGGKRVDGREKAFGEHTSLQCQNSVQVGKGGHRSGVGVVIGRHIDGLHGGDGTGAGRGDPFLEGAHFGR